MPSSYTTSLRLTLPATGELSGQWGNTVNTGITELLDAAVAGTASISTWGGAGVAYTLSNNSGTADEARKMFIVATGSPGEAKNVICPAVSKFYVFRNDTTGGFALTLKTSGGTGIAVPAGQYKFLYCDGTNVVEMFNSAGALTLSGALSVGGTTTLASNPTLSAGTANQVQYLNASKVLTGSANLTFDGTALTLGGNPTLSGGTANGVLYLNGSKVATSGSALVFDGTRLLVQTTSSNISSSERLTVNGLATTSISSTTVPAIYAQNSDTTASTNQPYIYLHDGVASRAGLGVNYTDSALVLNGFGGIYFRYGGNGMGTTEGMRLTSTGLGIGTSSPAGKLTVKTGTNENLSVVTGGSGDMRLSALNDAGSATVQLSIQGSPLYFRGVGGAINATLDSSGNLGLGVTPSAWNSVCKTMQIGPRLGIYDTGSTGAFVYNAYINTSGNFIYSQTAAAALYDTSAGQHRWYTAPSGTAGNAISFTQAMTLDASGNLLVGPTSNLGTNRRELVLQSANGSLLNLGINGAADSFQLVCDSGPNALIINKSNTPMIFYTNNTERARITSGGDLLVGTQSQPVGGVTAKLAVSQSAADYSSVLVSSQTTAANCYGARIQYTGAAPNGTGNPFLVMLDTGGDRAVFRSNGGLANYSANDVNLSDRREKTNFAPAKSYLDTICAIPVQTFEYIDQSPDDPGLTLGVVAQDVQAVAPELVMESNWGTEDNPKMRLSIYQTDLQYALMKCIQEQQALITALTARVAALEKP